jgi:hypothetical protein
MSLEEAITIAQLQSYNPAPGDPINQGDDHIRRIKAVLKNIFPGSGGQGFSIPITATEAQLNFVTGATSNIQAQLNALTASIAGLLGTLPAPVGTRLPFFQAAPPTGWSLVTDFNNYMLRVVNSTGGGSGGTDSPILNDKVASHTHPASSIVTDPGHSHTYVSYGGWQPQSGSATPCWWSTSMQNSGASLTGISVATSVSANAGASNWTPRYLDMVIGQKT